MTEQELQAIVTAAFEPTRELLDRMMTLIERLTARVEVLELEALHREKPDH